ncbi:MAG TPA: hypothetical protein VGM75_11620 [Pseudonocardiaceae bacterium]
MRRQSMLRTMCRSATPSPTGAGGSVHIRSRTRSSSLLASEAVLIELEHGSQIDEVRDAVRAMLRGT